MQADERQLPGEDLFRERATTSLVLELHQLVRRRKRVIPLRDHLAHVVRCAREAQPVLDVALVLAKLPRELADGVSELVGHLLVDHRLIEGREVLALEVLDERDLEGGRVVEALDDRRDRFLACDLRRTPAPFAGDDLVLIP